MWIACDHMQCKHLGTKKLHTHAGGSRFGALSIVLGDMGFFYQMYTPPYIILLIRTFLTLEGNASL